MPATLDPPGLIVLFGSGETSDSGRRVFEWLLGRLDPPIRVAVLETPAGFELNSELVAGRVAEFLRLRLQNHRPEVTVVPARRRGTPFSPDDPELARGLAAANVFFLGPGSPTYAIRQLDGSLVWQVLTARHRLGAAVVLASAAAIAAGAYGLPVYEIFKAGEDLHWRPGLDFLAPFGLRPAIVPHWNNAEGGATLDTSRSFMGRERFEELCGLLPAECPVVGLDEHTALILDLAASTARVLGLGGVTLRRGGREARVPAGDSFDLGELGTLRRPAPGEGLTAAVWAEVSRPAPAGPAAIASSPPPAVMELVRQREQHRTDRDWQAADDLRRAIAAAGWQVVDTADGPELIPLASP
jgi:cyanophycinase-like exopeptidase